MMTQKEILLKTAVERLTTLVTLAQGGATAIYVNTQSSASPIKDALDAITDNDETHRYSIFTAPGVYIEDNPIQGKSYVTVESEGMHSTRVVAANADEDLFLGVNLFYLIGFSFVGVTGATNYAVNHSAPGEMVVKNCVATDCSNGVLVNHGSALMNILDFALFTPTILNMQKGVNVLAGNVTISFLKVVATSTLDIAIAVDGSTSILSPDTIQSASPNLNKGIYATNGARVSGFGIKLVNMVDGLVLSGNNTEVRLNSVQIFQAQNSGLRVDNVGTGVSLTLFAATILNSVGLDFNILNPNSTISGNGFSTLANSFVVDGAKFFASILDISEDDEGLNILGELHVGSPINPAESVFGEGDSYTTGMLVYTYDGSTYADVSVAARTASASTFTFPNLNINTAIYVASSVLTGGDVLTHLGIKTKVSTAAVFGAGNIITEYWNGADWVEMVVMEVESTDKYYPRAKNIFQEVGSCQIRYNSEIQNDNWMKNDPMTLGTDYYWVRYRIEVAAITTAPIFEQWKLHSSRFEINADGWIEYYGKARPQGQLNLNLSAGRPFEGNMQSQTLYVSEDIGDGFTNNKFTATADKLGVGGFLPFDLDTSSPIKLQWAGHANSTGTYEWTIRWAWLKDGDPITYAEPGVITNSKSIVVSKAAILDQKVTFEALLDVSEMISRRIADFGDELWVSIQPTILPGNFSLASSQALYTKWSEGGHI